MKQEDEIKSAYRNLGRARGFYDGMMTGTGAAGRRILRPRYERKQARRGTDEAAPETDTETVIIIPYGKPEESERVKKFRFSGFSLRKI